MSEVSLCFLQIEILQCDIYLIAVMIEILLNGHAIGIFLFVAIFLFLLEVAVVVTYPFQSLIEVPRSYV